MNVAILQVGDGVLIGLYIVTLGVLLAYSTNFFYLTWMAWRRHTDRREPPELIDYPIVTVQVPIYNERYVAERSIDAVCRLAWPRDRLEIQILDDSTDATREIVAARVARWRADGINVTQLCRSNRVGYKAGALGEGLTVAHGEYVAIFDADFVPPPDFLRRAVPHLVDDPSLAFVQARWGHLNREASMLTRLQALWIDGHFLVEKFARDHCGFLLNFNGTAGVWRRAAIDDAGGWSAGTLTEDLDLSYRAELRGWRAQVMTDLVAPAELVDNHNAYRKQQSRWAQGSIECAVRLLPQVLRSNLRLGAKFAAVIHLTGYGIQVLTLLASLSYPFVLSALERSTEFKALYATSWLFVPISLAPIVLFLYTQLTLSPRRGWRKLPLLLGLTVLGSGMALNSTRAVWRGVRGRAAAFERTPKSGQTDRQRGPVGRAYTLPFDSIAFLELALSVFNLNTLRLAWLADNWGIAVYALCFAIGFAYVAGNSIWQARDALFARFSMPVVSASSPQWLKRLWRVS